MYQALYRKWRPATFADVVGQEAITTALQNQILADRVGHAYLFTGTRGTGKTTCAKVFAKAVNCENRHGAEPCGLCVPCAGTEDGSLLDVTEIDAASNNSVDDVRDLRDETAYRPSRARYKVYIIDEVHMLSPSAFNALLKIMEEPPSHVIFILATTELHKVPATILSRCQRYDFKRIPAEMMAGRLTAIADKEGIALAPEAADLIARLADGALRDAISLLDTCSAGAAEVNEDLVRRMAGVAGREHLFALSGAVAAGDVTKVMSRVAQMRDASLDAKRLAEELVYHYRNLLLAAEDETGKLLPNLAAEDLALYRTAAAETVPPEKSVRAMKRLAAALDRMARAPDPRIELELALIDLASPELSAGKSPSGVPQNADAQPPAGAPSTRASGPANAVSAALGAGAQAEVQAETHPEAQAETHPEAQAPSSPNRAGNAQPPAGGDAPGPPAEQTAPAGPQEQADAPGGAQADGANESGLELAPGADAPAADKPRDAAEAAEEAPLAEWPAVIEAMRGLDMLLYSYMRESQAYLSGRRVLIQGSDMFLSYMKQNEEAAGRVKDAIFQVTGQRCSIGPYKGEAGGAQPEKPRAQTTLDQWAALGVPIERPDSGQE